MKSVIFAGATLVALACSAGAATINLADHGLQLAGPEFAMSSSMSIVDTAAIDLGFTVIPGFFQAADFASTPTIELNSGDGIAFNLSVAPGFTGFSTVVAREGDRQLEFLFDVGGGAEAFGRLLLADGDSLDNLLTGALFSGASFAIWEVEKLSVSSIPLPAGMPLLLTGFAFLGFARRRKRLSSLLLRCRLSDISANRTA